MKKNIYRDKKEKANIIVRFGILIEIILLICITLLIITKIVKPNPIEDDEELSTQEVMEADGQIYQKKQNIKTYLLIGVDATGIAQSVSEYTGTGQSDVLQVLVVDNIQDTYTILPINRDTVTAVKSLDSDGKYLATTDIQIAFAHANGDGMEVSCENTVDAVSTFLDGQSIDGYMALNIDAIKELNRLAGGVTVTVDDDFSKADPTLIIGETVTLTDEQAMTYVRGRMNVGDGTNESRMRRQKQYVDALGTAFREQCSKDNNFPFTVYHDLDKYMVTNLTEKQFGKIANALLIYEAEEELSIDGTNAVDRNGFNAFTVDQDSLKKVLIQLFYEKEEG